eukprot:11671128-Alexandrium_andersonii.AAC.1
MHFRRSLKESEHHVRVSVRANGRACVPCHAKRVRALSCSSASARTATEQRVIESHTCWPE